MKNQVELVGIITVEEECVVFAWAEIEEMFHVEHISLQLNDQWHRDEGYSNQSKRGEFVKRSCASYFK